MPIRHRVIGGKKVVPVTFSTKEDLKKSVNLALSGAGGGLYNLGHPELSMGDRDRQAAQQVAREFKEVVTKHSTDAQYYHVAANAIAMARQIVGEQHAEIFSDEFFSEGATRTIRAQVLGLRVTPNVFVDSKVTMLLTQLSELTKHMLRYAEVEPKCHSISDERYLDLLLKEAGRMLQFDASKVVTKLKKPTMKKLIETAFEVLKITEDQVKKISDPKMRKEVHESLQIIHKELIHFKELRTASRRMDRVVQINLGIQVCGAIACAALLIAASVASMGVVPAIITGAIAAAMLGSLMWRLYQQRKYENKVYIEYQAAKTTEQAIEKLAHSIDDRINNLWSKTKIKHVSSERGVI